jgi:hypothetical protein
MEHPRSLHPHGGCRSPHPSPHADNLDWHLGEENGPSIRPGHFAAVLGADLVKYFFLLKMDSAHSNRFGFLVIFEFFQFEKSLQTS